MKKTMNFLLAILIFNACTSDDQILDELMGENQGIGVDKTEHYDKTDGFNPYINCEDIRLKDLADFPIGVSFGNIQNKPETQDIILNETSRITSTEFFASIIWRGENEFDFSKADIAVDYALSNGKEVHAHCLMYPTEIVNPGWLRAYRGNNQQFEALVKNYITTTVSRYRGRIKAYDITNELFAYNNSKVQPSWLRDRFSSDNEFFDFMGRCFKYAHEADPNALLFYNDYGQEYTNGNFEKGNAIVRQIQKWKQQGVPIHGYGLQMHTNIHRPIEDIERALELAASTGLLIHISELDVAINWAHWDVAGVRGGNQGVTQATADLLQRQKDMYRKVAQAYKKSVPQRQQYGITLWDTTDKYSWLNWHRFEAGTLFDVDYQRKPAFYGFAEGLSGQIFDCE
jgi:endo-1,4-beta-xylanase